MKLQGEDLQRYLKQGGLNKEEIQLNLCNIFSILLLNKFYFFRLMTLNCVKLGWAVTSMKYFAGIVSLFLPKSLIWNKTAFPVPNSLNFAELMENELMRSIYETFTDIPFFIQFIAAYCKDFKSL